MGSSPLEFGDPRLPPRFWAKVSVNPATGCWEWTGAKLPAGYGRFVHEQRAQYPHRITVTVERGEIPPGMHVDHLCRVKCCCNPLHLEAVSARENHLRAYVAEKLREQLPRMRNRKRLRIACVNGHTFTAATASWWVDKRGYMARICLLCKRDVYRRGKERR